jgi:hypothetical protein
MIRHIVLAGAALAATAPFSAEAQTTSRTSTVMDRPREELDAQGIRQGGFLIFPSIEAKIETDDNIFVTDTNTKSDQILTISPEIRADSNWNSHFLSVKAGGDLVSYDRYSAEDYTDYSVGTNGRLDIQRDMNATGALSFDKQHEDRSSPDDADGREPTAYTVTGIDVGFYNKWNRVSLNADAGLRRSDFDDVETSTGSSVNNDDRDRDEFKYVLRAGYEIQPEYEAFVQLIYTTVDYKDALDDGGVDRDSKGYEVRAGTRIDFTGLVFGDVFVGYLTRDYDDPTLKSASGVAAGFDMTWNVTSLTTLKGGLTREISESTQAGASGLFTTTVKASVDHELLRNLILSGNIGVSKDEYEGLTREDDTIRAGLAGKYMMNRNLYFTLQYDYATKDSNAANSDYDRNTLFLRVRAQM